MDNSFVRGLVIGGIIGASISMVARPGKEGQRARRKMMRAGRNFISRSGNLIGDVVDLFR